MAYVIPAVLVVLIVGGFVIFLVLNATKKSGPAAAGDEGAPGVGGDESPLGDTTEHADHDGRVEGAGDPAGDRDSARVARPGEAEGKELLGGR